MKPTASSHPRPRLARWLVAQYNMTLSTSYIYRVYSYDFSGFYFA